MSTRKRKQDDEELVALPSDESEEEEEYVIPTFPRRSILYCRHGFNWKLCSFTDHVQASQCDDVVDEAVCDCANRRHMSANWMR